MSLLPPNFTESPSLQRAVLSFLFLYCSVSIQTWFIHAEVSSHLSCHMLSIVLQTFKSSLSVCKRNMGDGARKPPRLNLQTDSSIKVTKIQTNIASPQTCFVTVILPHFLSLSLSPCALCLSFSPSLSLFLYFSFLPSSFFIATEGKAMEHFVCRR